MSKFSDFLGTQLQAFRIGIQGVRLKNVSGNLAVRNTSDSADAQLTASQVNNTGNDIVVGSTNTLTLSRNGSTASPLKVVFPATKGTDGQFFRVKAGTAADTIEFEAASIGGSTDKQTTDTTSFAFGSTSPVNLFTLPANAVVLAVRVIVDTAFNSTPSLSIGITGTVSKYVAANQLDLTSPATTGFEIYPCLPANGSTENLIATYASGGATVGAGRIEVDYVIPS